MPDVALWGALLLLVALGALVTRFNPVIFYARGTLMRLTVVVVVVFGAILMIGFFWPPDLEPSGIFRPNG